ncbi:MAG: BtpA/SgcQ family protein [Thermotogae bacterium]|nr:BtpA/SgcQ family protein [Thermotogota bacterium]
MGLFDAKPFVIGMVHARALPGSEKYERGSMSKVIDKAIEEAKILEDGGVDGLQVENMWDRPYKKGEEIGSESVAALSVVTEEVINAVKIPVGVNCHLNGGVQSLSIAVATGAKWIRVFCWVNAYISNVGLIEGIANKVLTHRRMLKAEHIKILADVHVKHGSHFIVNDRSLEEHAKDAEDYLADAIIVTGSATGSVPTLKEVKRVKESVNIPVFVGSGLTSENIINFIPYVDGCIVGSYFKKEGRWFNEVDRERVKTFMKIVKEQRHS